MLQKWKKNRRDSNLITNGTTNKDDNFIKEKGVQCPISVSQSRLTEPNHSTGESLRQALNPGDQVVKVGPGLDVGYPLQNTKSVIAQSVSLGDSPEGTITRPSGPMEATPVEVSSIERIPS